MICWVSTSRGTQLGGAGDAKSSGSQFREFSLGRSGIYNRKENTVGCELFHFLSGAQEEQTPEMSGLTFYLRTSTAWVANMPWSPQSHPGPELLLTQHAL